MCNYEADGPTPEDIRRLLRGRLYVSVPEAGHLFNLGRSASYAARARGQIPATKVGGSYRVYSVDLVRMLGLNPGDFGYGAAGGPA